MSDPKGKPHTTKPLSDAELDRLQASRRALVEGQSASLAQGIFEASPQSQRTNMGPNKINHRTSLDVCRCTTDLTSIWYIDSRSPG